MSINKKLVNSKEYDVKKGKKGTNMCTIVTTCVFLTSIFTLIAFVSVRIYSSPCLCSFFIDDCQRGVCVVMSNEKVRNMVLSNINFKMVMYEIKVAKQKSNLRKIFISMKDILILNNSYELFLKTLHNNGVLLVITDVIFDKDCSNNSLEYMKSFQDNIFPFRFDGVMFNEEETLNCMSTDFTAHITQWLNTFKYWHVKTPEIPLGKIYLNHKIRWMKVNEKLEFNFTKEVAERTDNVTLFLSLIPTINTSSLRIGIKNFLHYGTRDLVYKLESDKTYDIENVSFVNYMYQLISNRSFIYELESVLNATSPLNVALKFYSHFSKKILSPEDKYHIILNPNLIKIVSTDKKIYIIHFNDMNVTSSFYVDDTENFQIYHISAISFTSFKLKSPSLETFTVISNITTPPFSINVYQKKFPDVALAKLNNI